MLRRLERLAIAAIVCVDLCFSVSLRFLGPVLVLLAQSLIAFVVYMYLNFLVPRYVLPVLGGMPTTLLVVFGLFILFNIEYNYWCCVLTKPGYPADYLPSPDDLEEGVEFEDYGDGWRTCRKCRCGKPPRTHHCSVCRRCVMKMDHHCPWVNNCVGFMNYKFFCLFLIYLAAGCGYTALTCIIPMMLDGDLDLRRSQSMLFCFVLTLSVLFALTLFIGWHAFLIATNQTTIEFYSNRMDASDARKRGERWVNPFHVGYKNNFEQVFGKTRNPLSALLPSRKPPPGDGIVFALNPSLPDAEVNV